MNTHLEKMASTKVADSFQTPEYMKFKELVKKSAGDSSILVQDNKVVYGSAKSSVPSFRSVEDVKKELDELKLSILLKINDLYEKILVSDEPNVYKAKYQSFVHQVQLIEMMIDEIDVYVNGINEQLVSMPIIELQSRLDGIKASVQQTGNSTEGDVYVSKKGVKKLAELHKEGIKIEGQLVEAKEAAELNYIIWNTPQAVQSAVANADKLPIPLIPSAVKSSTRLSAAKKAIIKKTTKKVMLQKLA